MTQNKTHQLTSVTPLNETCSMKNPLTSSKQQPFQTFNQTATCCMSFSSSRRSSASTFTNIQKQLLDEFCFTVILFQKQKQCCEKCTAGRPLKQVQ